MHQQKIWNVFLLLTIFPLPRIQSLDLYWQKIKDFSFLISTKGPHSCENNVISDEATWLQ